MQKLLLGLDIGTNLIKAVQLSREKNISTLLAAGSIPKPLIEAPADQKEDEQKIANSINRLVHDMKISTTDVSASISSINVINQVIELPKMSEQELKSSISWEAEQYIPLPLSKVKLDYSVIESSDETKSMKILLVAAPIDLISKYMKIISLAGLNPLVLETEMIALSRVVFRSYPKLNNMLIVSLGAASSSIAILRDGLTTYIKTIPLGGNTLTRAISQELGFEIAQAEEYKKTYGLDEKKLEGKVVKMITPFIDEILVEIEKTVTFFKKQYPDEEVATIVLSGGGAKLPGLVSKLAQNLGIDSQIVNPFLNLSVDQNMQSILSPDASVYAAAVGLALKEI